jgi:hypothetical protein
MPKLNVFHPFRAAARAGAAATLAVGLFASSPYTNEARAIDISSTPNAVNASLVFSPAKIQRDTVDFETHLDFQNGDSFRICAQNMSAVTVQALYVFEDTFKHGQQIEQVTLAAGESDCRVGNPAKIFEPLDANPTLLPYIVLQSPVQCSQASEYPGKCRVVASFEREHFDIQRQLPDVRTHTEPVLLPGIPGSPRINSIQLPQ